MMSKQVRAVVISGNGTNCEREVANACRVAGAEVVDIVYLDRQHQRNHPIHPIQDLERH